MSNNYKNTVIAILLACILTMSIGYSVLSQKISIHGTSQISSTWDVKITNIESIATGDASNKEEPTHTNTTATFNTNLVSPKDKMTYNITIANNGTLDALLKRVNLTTSNNPAIIFDYNGVIEGEILKAGEKTTLQVIVEYSNLVTTQPEITESNLTITLDYIQHNATEEVPQILTSTLPAREDNPTYWFNEKLPNESIESISFARANEVPNDVGDNYFDISADQNGSIMAWYYDNDNNGLYEVVVGQDNKVIANSDSSHLFYKLTKLTTLDLTNLDTTNVIYMNAMFSNCTSLKSLNLDNLKTSNVITMRSMFWGCYVLKQLDLSNFDTEKLTDTGSMFSHCYSLESLNLKNWNTENIKDMSYMFDICSSLTKLDLSHFNTSSVTNMRAMFSNCNKLETLNISNFNTTNVTNMTSMFWGCYGLTTLDLSSFNTSNLKNANGMFGDNYNLKTIYASELWNNNSLVEHDTMFSNNIRLVGAISFDSTKTDGTYANYTNGYFTYKEAPTNN